MSRCALSTGFSVSVTVTAKDFVVLFACASVAVTVTVVVPTGKTEPEAGLLVMVTVPGQLSVAVGVKVATAPHAPESLLRVIFVGTVSDGPSTSFIVTWKEQLATPHELVAVAVTVVVPTGNA